MPFFRINVKINLTLFKSYFFNLLKLTTLGAQSSAIIYSIIETAKANDLNPMDYLANIFEGIRSGKKADELMPWTI